MDDQYQNQDEQDSGLSNEQPVKPENKFKYILAIIVLVIIIIALLISAPSIIFPKSKSASNPQGITASSLKSTSTISPKTNNGVVNNTDFKGINYINQSRANEILGVNGVYKTASTTNLDMALSFYPSIGQITTNISQAWMMKYTNLTGCNPYCRTFTTVTYVSRDSRSIYDSLLHEVPQIYLMNLTLDGVTYSIVNSSLRGSTTLNLYALDGDEVTVVELYTNSTINQSLIVSSVLAKLAENTSVATTTTTIAGTSASHTTLGSTSTTSTYSTIGSTTASTTIPNTENGNITVTLVESGLPNLQGWSAELIQGNQTYSQLSFGLTTLAFKIKPGRYEFRIPDENGYLPNPSSGNITVTSNTTYQINFAFNSTPKNKIVFVALGLPLNTMWSVTLGGSTQSSITQYDNITVSGDGPFDYTINPVSGYLVGVDTYYPFYNASLLNYEVSQQGNVSIMPNTYFQSVVLVYKNQT
jgi:hypothetical protein